MEKAGEAAAMQRMADTEKAVEPEELCERTLGEHPQCTKREHLRKDTSSKQDDKARLHSSKYLGVSWFFSYQWAEGCPGATARDTDARR